MLPARRGSTLILVIWTIGITTLVVLSLQMSAFRQAASGREALGRVRARWAARAGVEACIAWFAWDAQSTTPADYVQVRNALEEIARGELGQVTSNGPSNAEYLIQHTENGRVVDGPADAHAKFNVNLMSQEMLLALDLEGMSPELANGILDWIDQNQEPREGGAEVGYYLQTGFPYEPRNSVIRAIEELELIRDIDPVWLRGEDWNLNGVLDPNENDGDLTPPDDDEDDELDAGWTEYLTAATRASGMGASGEPKLDLGAVEEASEVRRRLQVDNAQAEALMSWAQGQGVRVEDLILTPLSQIGQSGQTGQQGGATTQNQPTGGASSNVRDLTQEQLRTVLAEATVGPVSGLRPGKLNLNTAPAELFEALPQVDRVLADRLALYREGRPHGYESVLDLLELQGMNEERVAALAPYLDVRSNVFIITSRGIGLPGRTEVELVVTIDRSTLPIRILEYFER